jgi:hypothetical protein
MPDHAPVAEGDDFAERPLQVILFGGQFAALDDAEAMGLSASGPRCLQPMALRLLRAGFDPDRPLILYRANQNIGRTTVGKAAQQQEPLG